MSFLYLVTLAVLFILFTVAIFFLKKLKNTFLWNIIFISAIFLFYVSVVVTALIRNGPNDWNFQNTLLTANISPFMFTICPIYLFLPIKIRKCFGALISLLTVGMILSPSIGCIYCFSISYKYHFFFSLDYITHFIFALFGIYLIQSKQVELNIKNSLIGGSLIIGVCLIMLIINLIADTSFFGLSLRGKHNIYNQVITDNSYLSALIYFSGLLIVLCAGFLFQKLLQKFIKTKPDNLI